MNNISLGDMFQLGDHRLASGSACNKTLVERLIGKDKVSLILCDPPYGINYVSSKQGFTAIKNHKHILNDQFQTDDQYKSFTISWLEAIRPFLSKKNSIYIFNSDKMLFALQDGMKAAGFTLAQLLIWVKNNVVMGRLNYLSQHELIVYGWYGTHKFMKSQDKNVLFYPKPHNSLLHPTMKPVGLLRRLILNSSRIEDYVYDSFLGSGSTLIACEQTKRKCLAIEIDSEYCQTIIARWEKLTGQKAEKIA